MGILLFWTFPYFGKPLMILKPLKVLQGQGKLYERDGLSVLSTLLRVWCSAVHSRCSYIMLMKSTRHELLWLERLFCFPAELTGSVLTPSASIQMHLSQMSSFKIMSSSLIIWKQNRRGKTDSADRSRLTGGGDARMKYSKVPKQQRPKPETSFDSPAKLPSINFWKEKLRTEYARF